MGILAGPRFGKVFRGIKSMPIRGRGVPVPAVNHAWAAWAKAYGAHPGPPVVPGASGNLDPQGTLLRTLADTPPRRLFQEHQSLSSIDFSDPGQTLILPRVFLSFHKRVVPKVALFFRQCKLCPPPGVPCIIHLLAISSRLLHHTFCAGDLT